MTVTDRTDATEQEFRDRIAAFESAPTPPEVREAAVVEEVARALHGVEMIAAHWDELREVHQTHYRRLAAAAVAAYRATQDGGAEEAVSELPVARGPKPTGARRVHGRDISVKRTGKGEESQVRVSGLPVLSQADARWLVNQLASVVVMPPRAALAPQAGDEQ